jgi:hypothetical protein
MVATMVAPLMPDRRPASIHVSTHGQKTKSQRDQICYWLDQYGIPPDAVPWVEDKETGKILMNA